MEKTRRLGCWWTPYSPKTFPPLLDYSMCGGVSPLFGRSPCCRVPPLLLFSMVLFVFPPILLRRLPIFRHPVVRSFSSPCSFCPSFQKGSRILSKPSFAVPWQIGAYRSAPALCVTLPRPFSFFSVPSLCEPPSRMTVLKSHFWCSDP